LLGAATLPRNEEFFLHCDLQFDSVADGAQDALSGLVALAKRPRNRGFRRIE
jgi:hypothetical protein